MPSGLTDPGHAGPGHAGDATAPRSVAQANIPTAVEWDVWLTRPSEAGIITDFDGTLAPIVERPQEARPLPGSLGTLAKLARRFATVAVVSGRPLAYLQAHLGSVPGLVLIGLYGMERSDGDKVQVPQDALAWQPTVAFWARAARDEAPDGIDVELKGLSFALHTRRHPDLGRWAADWAASCAARSGLVPRAARLSIELLPPVATDKGTVVEQLATNLAAVCFLGDDSGDVPAFAALKRLSDQGKVTVSVGVRSEEEPAELLEAADLLVEGPEGALGLLQHLAG